MLAAIPTATGALQSASVLPAAKGICTTDLYAKVRSAVVPGTNGGRIVGIAKGAGMIEPNLATMLVYVLTDVAVPRDSLRAMLPRAVDGTFNALTIDSDQSTSDTVVAVSSGVKPIAPEGYAAFEAALTSVCASLSEDIVRNGEGVQHVIRVQVRGATTKALARAVGKSIVNSPLFKCAVAGNDPNVGRLVAAIGKCVGVHPDGGRDLDMSRATLKMGGLEIFSKGQFRLTPDVERTLVKHMRDAQLWGE
jgi:glutamate N-acetyltransferase / amino-acid N-acetyltransferase